MKVLFPFPLIQAANSCVYNCWCFSTRFSGHKVLIKLEEFNKKVEGSLTQSVVDASMFWFQNRDSPPCSVKAIGKYSLEDRNVETPTSVLCNKGVETPDSSISSSNAQGETTKDHHGGYADDLSLSEARNCSSELSNVKVNELYDSLSHSTNKQETANQLEVQISNGYQGPLKPEGPNHTSYNTKTVNRPSDPYSLSNSNKHETPSKLQMQSTKSSSVSSGVGGRWPLLPIMNNNIATTNNCTLAAPSRIIGTTINPSPQQLTKLHSSQSLTMGLSSLSPSI